jgi:hypothetical protein
MTSCIPKKKVRRVRLFALDSCGRMITTGTPVLDWDGFNEIRYQNVIDDGVDETITNVHGETCIDDQACPIDRGVSLSFTECKENDSFAALTGYGSLVSLLGDVVGFDRTKMIGCNSLAAELLFDVPSLCDANGDPQCISMLIPSLKLFKDVSERVIDSKNTLRGTYTSRAQLNGRLFELLVGGLPPAELAYWTPWITNIAAGTSWFLRRVVDCPTLASPVSCELRALVV